MMKIVTILIIALGVMLLSSCTKEPMGGNEPQPEGTVQIKFALSDNGAAQPTTPSRAGETDAGDPAESRIRYLKVLFYNIGATDETSTLKSSSMYDLTPQSPDSENDPIDKGYFNWNPVTKVLTFRFYATEKYKVVVIANWGDPNWFKKVQNIKALDECFTNIDAKDAYNLANGSTPLILMSGAIEHNFKMNPRATMPLIRQLARIDLNVTFNADFLKAYPGLNFQNPDLRFYNMPNCSYIRDTKVSNPKFVELLKQSGNYLFNFIELKYSDNMPPLFKTTAYAYENLTFGNRSDNAETRKNAFFMVMKIPYTLDGTTVTENYYKFYINDLSPDAAASPHKTVRNHLYRVGVEVNGFGGATPNDDYIRVTTEVLPWNSVLVSDEQGEFLKVDKTTIRLKHTIADTTLVVKSHDPENTTVTAAGGKVDVAYNKATGVVTLNKATYDSAIKKPILDYETIIIKAGSLTKTVNIEYEPVIWATGDIALNHPTTPQDFIFGTPGDPTIVLFTFGSRIAITQGPWGQAMMMWKNGDFISREEATTPDVLRERSAEFPGDPCAYVTYYNKDEKWRTPTKEEFEALNNPLGKEGQRYGMRGYLFSGMKDAEGNDVFLNSSFHMRLPDTSDGLRGYYWSSTSFDNRVGWDFIADEYFESGVLFAPTRINREDKLFQFPVRCVRDFR